jgi:hypothetical protein
MSAQHTAYRTSQVGYAMSSNNVRTGITIARWLAILCTEKDNELSQS